MNRLDMIVHLIADDELACSLLENLLVSAKQYFCKVFEKEAQLKVSRLRLDVAELRNLQVHLDENRRFAHKTLSADLHIFNRYINNEFGEGIPIGGIYSNSAETNEDLDAISDWIGELLAAVYQNRKR